MRDEFRQHGAILSAQSQDSSVNCFLIAIGYVATTNQHLTHEKSRVRAVCSRVLHLADFDTVSYPRRLYDVFLQGIEDTTVIWEICSGRDDVGNMVYLIDTTLRFVEGNNGTAMSSNFIR